VGQLRLYGGGGPARSIPYANSPSRSRRAASASIPWTEVGLAPTPSRPSPDNPRNRQFRGAFGVGPRRGACPSDASIENETIASSHHPQALNVTGRYAAISEVWLVLSVGRQTSGAEPQERGGTGATDMTFADKAVLGARGNRCIGRALIGEALGSGARRVYASTRQPWVHFDRRVTPLTLDVTNAARRESP
jgi:hypothetical protein